MVIVVFIKNLNKVFFFPFLVKWPSVIDNTLHQNVESMIRTFYDYVFTLVIESYKTSFMTIRLFYQKYDYITKL